jgi:hypothetical protein
MGFVRGEPVRLAPVKVLVPPFAMVCLGSDEWVLRADSAFAGDPGRSASSPSSGVQGRCQLRPLNVDSSRPVRANSGRSDRGRRSMSQPRPDVSTTNVRGLNDFSVLSQPGYGGNIGRSRPPNVRSSGTERSRDVVDQEELARGLAFD